MDVPPFPPDMTELYKEICRKRGDDVPTDAEAERTARAWWELTHTIQRTALQYILEDNPDGYFPKPYWSREGAVTPPSPEQPPGQNT